MKKYFKFIPYLMFVFALALNSCSEEEVMNVENESNIAMKSTIVTTLQFENAKAIVKNDGTFDYYLDDVFQYSVDMDYNDTITVVELENSTEFNAGNDKITFEYLNSQRNSFNVLRSDQGSASFGTITSTSPVQTEGCIPCWVPPVMWLVDTVVEALEPSEAENCAAAAETSCGSGNVKSFKSVLEEGFFGDSISCEFECKE